MNEAAISISRYILIFSAILAASIAVTVALIMLFDADIGLGVTNAQTIFAASSTALIFIRKNKRQTTKEERNKLIWLSLAAVLLVSGISVAVLVVVMYFDGGLDLISEVIKQIPSVPVIMWLIILVVAAGVQLLMLHLSYRFIANIIWRSYIKNV
jgi:hypothetical protein